MRALGKARTFVLFFALAVAGCSSAPLPAGSDLAGLSDLAHAGDLASPGGDLAASPAAGCVASGGTVSMNLCCAASGDFPNTCGIGACSCAPASSHMIMVCVCPGSTCFDGTRCM
jgi:hypothetical protein